MILKTYEDFITRVNELGFMTLSTVLTGLPSLADETPKENWHTGNQDTDPWRWKDRAAEEKQLAFGCILGGHKGFVSARMYSVFYAAYHPQEHMEERRASGVISQTTWELWQLFQQKTMLDTSDIRQEMGVTLKQGGSKVDKAITELQHVYYITVAGNRRKTDKFGKPYGWPANVYDKVENWVPTEWVKQIEDIGVAEARENILDVGVSISKNIGRDRLARLLGLAN